MTFRFVLLTPHTNKRKEVKMRTIKWLKSLFEKKAPYYSFKDGTPLYTHWVCPNCNVYMSDAQYKAILDDIGCGKCGTTLYSYAEVEVDTQKAYDKLMGFDK